MCIRDSLYTYPDAVDKAVISGTGWEDPTKVRLGKLICRLEQARVGETSTSKLVTKLMFGSYNKPFGAVTSPNAWICSDEAVVAAYDADPLCGFDATVGLARDLLTGVEMNEQPENLDKMNKQLPLLFVSCYLYGLRPLLLCGFALLMGNLCDRLISLLRRRVYQAGDYSNESFALVITLLMPATVDWYVLAAAIVAGVLIGKEVFGGYGSYPFNPAAVGYAVAAVSWPEQVFRYPTPYTSIPLWDASGVVTASTISDTLRSGGLINLSGLSLALGEYAAPMGAGSALVLAACGLFLWVQKDIKLSAALSFLVTAGVIVFLFPRQLGLTEDASFAVSAMFRLRCVRDELLTGAMIFSAVFLLNEPYTCAHHRLGRILYGVMVGAFTMGFRYFGVYETGVCFAILAVNSISGWLDRTEVHLYELLHSSWKKQTGKGDAV